VKRSFDIIIALVALLILAIPVLVVALMVKLTSCGTAFYWSDRVGRNNTIFKMPKFRTMRIDTPAVASHLLLIKILWLTLLKVLKKEGVSH
jgi:O-antigen biosynthesis protein WbqP